MAVDGHGAFVNGKRITTSRKSTLESSVVVHEFGYERSDLAVATMLEATRRVLSSGTRALRQIGSGVLDLVYVACGRLDAVYTGETTNGWKPWDYCAAQVIGREAGASFNTIGGGEFTVESKSLVCAATPELGRLLRAAIDAPGMAFGSALIFSNHTEGLGLDFLCSIW